MLNGVLLDDGLGGYFVVVGVVALLALTAVITLLSQVVKLIKREKKNFVLLFLNLFVCYLTIVLVLAFIDIDLPLNLFVWLGSLNEYLTLAAPILCIIVLLFFNYKELKNNG